VFPHVLVHPSNVYVYCAVCPLGLAVTLTHPIVKVVHHVEIDVQYSAVTDPLVTVPYPLGVAFIVTVYLFFVAAYVAL